MKQLHAIYVDIRHACRLLARRPGFTAIAVLTLAVGLGTMTVAFSAVNAFFLASPFIDTPGAGLVMISDDAPETSGASCREFEAYARDVPALDIAAQTIVTLSHRRDNAVAMVWGLAVSDHYFDVLGATAAAGRAFTAGGEPRAIVSDRFWREQLSSASLGGLTARLNELDVPIDGVLPRDFRAGLYDPDVWVRVADWDALRLPARSRRPDALAFTMFGRLRAGASDALADAQLRSVARELSRAWPDTNARRTASFEPFDGGLPGLPDTRMLAVVAAMAMA